MLRHRIARACLASAALFAISAAVPEPFRYILWAIAIGGESGVMLRRGPRRGARRPAHDHDWKSLAPAGSRGALDPHHFAERFGLFLIILLGEVMVEAGQAPVGDDVGPIIAVMLLAAALWWVYFDSAAEVNLKVLELSGGSPTMARAIFAVGHMLPAFALLLTASGVGLLLEEDPPPIADWLACVGVGIYLARHARVPGGRAPGVRPRARAGADRDLPARPARACEPHAYLWLLAVWLVGCAALTTRQAVDGAAG